MMNYNSTVNVLMRAGFTMTNKCHYEGETFHDFNSRRKDACISLVVDEVSGSVIRAEVTNRKWDDARGRYMPVKEIITGLQELMKMFAPRTPMSF